MHLCNEPKEFEIQVEERCQVIQHDAYTFYLDGWRRATEQGGRSRDGGGRGAERGRG